VVEDIWYIAGHHWPDSGIAVWPCTLQVIENGSNTYLEPQCIDEPKHLALTELVGWEAVPLCWRSPMWQMKRHRIYFDKLCPAIRPFFGDKPRGLLDTAARQAFWKMSISTLKDIAAFHGIKLVPGASDAEILFTIIQGCTGLGDEAVLDIVAKRLGVMSLDTEFAGALLCIDEAVDCLDHTDIGDLSAEQKNASKGCASRKAFVAAYHALRFAKLDAEKDK
jgi:hypothetical protein